MASSDVLSEQYTRRFLASQAYRDGVWKVILQRRLQHWVGHDQVVLDLGCGWGEFIRNVSAADKYAMDLNPDAATHVGPGVQFLQQDCASRWRTTGASTAHEPCHWAALAASMSCSKVRWYPA